MAPPDKKPPDLSAVWRLLLLRIYLLGTASMGNTPGRLVDWFCLYMYGKTCLLIALTRMFWICAPASGNG